MEDTPKDPAEERLLELLRALRSQRGPVCKKTADGVEQILHDYRDQKTDTPPSENP